MNYIKLPNRIFGFHLNAAELMTYTALKASANVFNFCTVKHSTLAEKIGASTDTVARAVSGLERQGLLHIKVRYNTSGNRIANGYTLTALHGSYTKIPTNIFYYRLPKSVFKVYLYLMKCRDNKSLVAVPSLAELSSNLGMSKRTVVDAVKYLNDHAIIYKASYNRKTDRRIGRNRHTVFTTAFKAVLLSMVNALKSAQKKMRANPYYKAAPTMFRNLFKSISIFTISQMISKIKGFFVKVIKWCYPLLI